MQADLEEHAASLALLTADVADIPPDILEEAIRRHVAQSPYMPKASELIALAKGIVVGTAASAQRLYDHVANLNRSITVIGNRWEYYVARREDGEAYVDRRDLGQVVVNPAQSPTGGA